MYYIEAELKYDLPKLGLEAGDLVNIIGHDENTVFVIDRNVDIVADSVTKETIRINKSYIKVPNHVKFLI